MAPVSHFTARATTGAGLAFSLYVYGVPQTLTWALAKEEERESWRESWAKTFPCCAHTHKKHEFVFCSAVDAAGQ